MFQKFLSAKNPMIIIGSACAQGEKGAEVVAKAQQLVSYHILAQVLIVFRGRQKSAVAGTNH